MAVVTALRAAGRGRVSVELDGERWRTLPHEAVVRAGLAVGGELDRRSARTLARERRRLAALDAAARALRSRERSEGELRERLERRGVVACERDHALDTLKRAGLVDDARFAAGRAAALARRGYGDAAIRHDLDRRGLGRDEIDAALAALAPEAERAEEQARRLGGGPRAARTLARRGFGEDVVASLVAGTLDAELG